MQQRTSQSTQIQSVDIEDIAKTDVVTAEPDTPIPTLSAKMEQDDVGSVVIVDDDKPVGVVTDRTIALLLQETEDVTEATARDIMPDDLTTGTTMLTVKEALQQMKDADIRRLPIVDEDGTLEGIVTLDDMLVLLSTELEMATEIIKSQASRL